MTELYGRCAGLEVLEQIKAEKEAARHNAAIERCRTHGHRDNYANLYGVMSLGTVYIDLDKVWEHRDNLQCVKDLHRNYTPNLYG